MTWDAENRLVGYQSSVSSASYAYDGDGVRVKTVITDSGGVTTTVHIGGTYEWVDGSAARSYYYQGSQRVAMREGGELYFLLRDHLGSTSVSYRVSDGQTVTQTYHAWGHIRPGPDNELPTDYAFTGQRLQGETGLYQMGARWYDALTGRWLSADTIVPGPGNPQSLNRYTYVYNNPLAYIDPSGHWPSWLDCTLGSFYQLANDLSYGLPNLAFGTEWQEAQSAAFQRGQQVGRALSRGVTYALMADGALRMIVGSGLLAPTVLLAVPSGGTIAIAAPIELGLILEGAAKVVLAGSLVLYASGNPLDGPRYTRHNFRRNLEHYRPKPPDMKNPEAHHVLPQRLRKIFAQMGIDNIHEPRWGAWVEQGPHRHWSYDYDQRWFEFLTRNSEASIDDIVRFAEQMAREFNFAWP